MTENSHVQEKYEFHLRLRFQKVNEQHSVKFHKIITY